MTHTQSNSEFELGSSNKAKRRKVISLEHDNYMSMLSEDRKRFDLNDTLVLLYIHKDVCTYVVYLSLIQVNVFTSFMTKRFMTDYCILHSYIYCYFTLIKRYLIRE